MTEKDNNQERVYWCGDCHYSKNGTVSCFRMMQDTKPKIDLSKGAECAHNGHVHYLKYNPNIKY